MSVLKISNKKPESKGVPNELLKLRWTHFEEVRVDKILQCREERRYILQEEQEGGNPIITVQFDQPVASQQRLMSAKPSKVAKLTFGGMTDLMRKEKEALQRVLEGNIQKKLQYEQQLADIQARNEQKMRLQREKEEENRRKVAK